jgi:Peptidase S24-like
VVARILFGVRRYRTGLDKLPVGSSSNRVEPFLDPVASARGLRCDGDGRRYWLAMGALDAYAAQVAAGGTVSFRPTGSSMAPLIRSRQLVTVQPIKASAVEVGDIVLARVKGTVYLHLVSAVDNTRGRVEISNNRGRVNGWTDHARVYGLVTSVEGVPRPRIDGKTEPSAPTSATQR